MEIMNSKVRKLIINEMILVGRSFHREKYINSKNIGANLPINAIKLIDCKIIENIQFMKEPEQMSEDVFEIKLKWAIKGL